MVRLLLISILLSLHSVAFAAPATFSYQGQIIKDNGQALTASSVSFLIQIYSPGAEECLLYEETQTINMSGSNGLFAIQVGDPANQSGTDYEDITPLSTALSNTTGAVTPTTCVAGPTYTPAFTDGRKLRITFDDGSGPQTISQDHNIVSVPYADSASSIDGLASTDLLQINTSGSYVLTQANVENIFDGANHTELLALIGGTSSLYLQSTPTGDFSMNSNRITDLNSPAAGTDAANKNYVDQNLGQSSIADLSGLGGGNAGEVLSWNGTQWVNAAPAGDSTKLPLAGGTMTGPINMGGQNITNLNDVAAGNDLTVGNNATVTGSVSANGISSSGTIVLYNGANYVGFQAPAGSTDEVWTLPADDGTPNQVLTTDGSGQLVWANDNAPVTSVFGRTGIVAAQTSDYDADQIDNTPAGDIAASDVQGAIDELDGEKVSAAGDAMTGNLEMNTNSEIRFRDADDSHYVGFVAPANITAGTSFVWTLPVDDGSNLDVLQTDGSGNLSWVAIPTAPVTSVHGRTGIVAAQNGDYTASQVTNVAAGGISAVTVQAAINELDTEKLSAVAGASLTDSNMWVGNGSNQAAEVTMSGDATMANTGAVTIANNAVTSAKINDGEIVNADINASADIARSKLADGAANRIVVNDGSGAMIDAAAITGNRALTSDANGIPIASSVTDTELGYVSGVTSAIQTQLDSKIDSTLTDSNILVGNGSNVATGVAMSGDATMANTGALTIANNAVTSAKINDGEIVNADINASAAIDAAKIHDGSVSNTEFGYLDGVTSAIQTQLDSKQDSIGADSLDFDDLADAMTLDATTSVDMDTNTADLNFDSNTLYIDSSANRVGVGLNDPDTAFEVAGTIKVADGSETCSAGADGGMIRYSGTDLQYCNGSAWTTLGISGAGMTSLGGQTGSTQTFAAGSAGNSPAIASAGDTHTLNVPLASAGASVTSGTISNADYVSFSNKLDAVAGETLADTNIWVGNGSNQAAAVAMSGDATMANTGAVSLANDSVDTVEIVDDAVTSAKINDGEIVDADVNASANINATKLGTGVVDNTEFNYLNGVTSAIQTQLDSKQGTIGADSLDFDDLADAMTLDATTSVDMDTNTADLNFDSNTLFIDSSANRVAVGLNDPDTAFEVAGTIKVSDGSETCSAGADGGMIRYNGGNLQFCNGSAWTTLGVSGAGLTSLGGQTGSTQTFAAGSAGNSPAIASAGDTHTLNVPLASAGASVTSGTISNADYVSFGNKLDAVAGETLADTNIWVGNGSNQAAAVAMSGDATMANTGAVTIANNAITSAKINDGEIVNADINASAAIDAAKIHDGSVSNTEYGYLDGVTSAIQTQLDGKVNDTGDTMTGQLLIDGGSDQVQLAIEGDAAQSTNLVEIRNSASTVVASISSDGTVSAATDLATKSYVDGQVGSLSSDSIEDADGNTQIQVEEGANDDTIRFDTAGTERMIIDSSGNIGIGTATAANDLHLYTSGNTGLMIDSGGGFNAGIDLVENGTGRWSLSNVGSGDNFVLWNQSGSQNLVVEQAGNVGIGTTTPDTILEIAGTLKVADGSETCSAGADGGMIHYNGGNLQFCNGSAWTTLGVSGAGLTSLGGQTGSTQSFAAGSAGNSPAITSGSDTHTLNVPLASAGASVTSGTISNADYVSFSNKLDAIAGETLADTNIWVGNGSNQAAAVAMSGDATMANTGALTIANNAVTSAKINDGEIVNADINASAAIDAAKIHDGSVSNTEYGYLDGVTSAIQTQLDGKVNDTGDTMTGQLLIDGGSDQVQFAVEGDAAQSANLVEIRNSASTVVASISSDGSVSAATDLATKAYVDGAVSGSGDVSGPASSTDRAIAIYDGTGGDTLQNSGVIIDASDNVSGVTTLSATNYVNDNATYTGEAYFGNGSSVSGNSATAIGDSATAGANGTAVGEAATAGGGATAVGEGASATGVNGGPVAVGDGANAAGDRTIAIGQAASAASNNTIAIGNAASASGQGAIAIGRGAVAAGGELVVGTNVSTSSDIENVYIGGGKTNSAPLDTTYHATGGDGTDIAGANFVVAGGRGTGSGNGGAVIFQTAPAGGSGTALNALSEQMRIDSDGNVGIGTATPGDNLHVLGAGYLQAIFESTDSSGGIGLHPSTGDEWEIQGTRSGAGVPNAFVIYNRTDTAYRLVVDDSGDVGIGTETPDTILEIAGTLKLADGSETCSAGADGGMIRYTGGNLQFCNGSSWQTLGVSGAGLTSLGGQTGSTQTFAAGSAGNSPAISSGSDTHTLNVPLASAGASVTSGTISNADYVSFSNKLDAVAGETLADTNIWVGNGSNQAAAVAMSGDATMANTGAVTIANNAVTSAKINDDEIVNADINSGANIDATKLGTGVVDNTEFNYLNGVTSALQTQLDGKVNDTGDTMTGQLLIDGGSDQVQFAIEGDASQSANLVEIRNSASTVVASISSDGSVSAATDLATKAYVDSATSGGGDILNDGNSEGATVTIGTNDTEDLAFETDGTTRMTIEAGGEIDLANGTIFGGGGANRGITFGNDIDYGVLGAHRFYVDTDNSSATEAFAVYDNVSAGTTTASAVAFKTSDAGTGISDNDPDAHLEVSASGTTGGNLLLLSSNDDNDGDIMTVLESGNVGIGSTAPVATLDVPNGWVRASDMNVRDDVAGIYSPTAKTASLPALGISNFSTNDGTVGGVEFELRNSNLNTQWASVNAVSTAGAGVYTPSIVFQQQTGAATYAERMRIDENGRLGIGTNAPEVALDVGTGVINASQICDETNSTCIDLSSAVGTGDFMSTGSVAMTGAIRMPDGAAGTPSLTFTDDTNTGIFSAVDNTLNFTTNGTNRLQINTARVTSNLALSVNNGTEASPSFTMSSSDTDTGMYRPADNEIAFSNAGSEAMRIDASGNVGIGTDNPLDLLHVNGIIRSGVTNGVFINGPSELIDITSGSSNAYDPASTTAQAPSGAINIGGNSGLDGEGKFITFRNRNTTGDDQRSYIGQITNAAGLTPDIVFGAQTGANAYTERMRIDENGRLGIGTTSPEVALDVGTGVINASQICDETNSTCIDLSSAVGTGDFMSTGSVPMTGAIRLPNGSSGTPSLTFTSDTDTGIYGTGSNIINFATNGINRAQIANGGVESFQGFAAANGSVSDVDYGFFGDIDTGLNSDSANTLSLVTDGTERLSIDSSGNVGLGTTSPATTLDINGAESMRGMAAPALSPAGQGRIYFDSTSNKYRVSENGGAYADLVGGGSGDVSGPGSSTDRAIAIYDGTGGDTLQDSGVTIDASDNISGVTTFSATNYVNDNATYTSEAYFGNGSAVTGNESTAIGDSATSVAAGVAVGYNSDADGANGSVALGYSATASSDRTIAIGAASSASGQQSIAIGHGATTSSAGAIAIGMGSSAGVGEMVVGGTSTATDVADVYIGSGVTNSSPLGTTFHATGGSGTNIAGADLTLAGGRGTGSGIGGSVIFQTSSAGSSGTTLRSLVERMRIDTTGNVGIGTTSANDKLVVDGTIRSLAAVDQTSNTTIDFTSGNIQYTSDNCQAYTLHNMRSGGSYTFVVQGATSATCSFTAYSDDGTGAPGTQLTVHMPTGHGATTASTHTIYTAIVAGTHIYFAWSPGL